MHQHLLERTTSLSMALRYRPGVSGEVAAPQMPGVYATISPDAARSLAPVAVLDLIKGTW